MSHSHSLIMHCSEAALTLPLSFVGIRACSNRKMKTTTTATTVVATGDISAMWLHFSIVNLKEKKNLTLRRWFPRSAPPLIPFFTPYLPFFSHCRSSHSLFFSTTFFLRWKFFDSWMLIFSFISFSPHPILIPNYSAFPFGFTPLVFVLFSLFSTFSTLANQFLLYFLAPFTGIKIMEWARIAWRIRSNTH